MSDKFYELAKKNYSLEGLRGIVTGGSKGLGKTIALTLSEAGAEVVALSRTGAFIDDAKTNENLKHIKADVNDFKSMDQIVNEISGIGLDFLINNAGVSLKKNLENIDQEEWRHIQSTNVDSIFYLSKLAFQYLRKSKNAGRIVNITSMASHLAFNQVAAYTTSKSALLGLTRSMAVEWANENILVNSVSPGWIKTDMVEKVLDEEREKKILNRMPLHKYGEPNDIANMVWYLVSPASKYITGQDFSVDGGALHFGY